MNDSELRDHIRAGHLLRFSREHHGLEEEDGFLHGFSDAWFLIQRIAELSADGHALLRRSEVSWIRYSPCERFFQRVLRGEGIRKERRAPRLDLSDLRGVFETLHHRRKVLIVERELVDEDDFLMGPIEWVAESSVWIRHVQANGEWDPEPTERDFDEITRIAFDTPYAKTFMKYVRRP